MPRKKQVSDIKRKSLSFNVEDHKQKLAYDFLEKLDRKQTFFLTNIICAFLQKNNALDIDSLSKKELERLVIASEYASAELDILSSYLGTMGLYAGQMQMQQMQMQQMMPNMQMMPYPIAPGQIVPQQNMPVQVPPTIMQEVKQVEPVVLPGVAATSAPTPDPSMPEPTIPQEADYTDNDDENDDIDDIDDVDDFYDDEEGGNNVQKKQIMSAINSF